MVMIKLNVFIVVPFIAADTLFHLENVELLAFYGVTSSAVMVAYLFNILAVAFVAA